MDYFTQKDHDWLQRVRELPKEYMIAIANDGIWTKISKSNLKKNEIF